MRSFVTVLLTLMFVISALIPSVSADEVLDGERAIITLGIDPEPPEYVENPGGQLSVFWLVEYSTTPDHVVFSILSSEEPAEEIHREEFEGLEGVEMELEWTVPEGLENGVYWVRVEYWSVEIDLEAHAEVAFLIDQTASNYDEDTWGQIKGLFAK